MYLYIQESNNIFICEIWLLDAFFFLNSANLICRSMDISKYFRESLGLRENESRLYLQEASLSQFIFLSSEKEITIKGNTSLPLGSKSFL